MLTKKSRISRANVAYLHDVIMAALSFALSLYLRLGSDIQLYAHHVLLGMALFAVTAAIVFRSNNLYRGIWRYASVNDLMAITRATTLTILVFLPLMFLLTRLEDLPRSLPFINWFVLMILLGGPRFAYRLFKDRRIHKQAGQQAQRGVPLLLVGAGDEAETFIRAAARSPDANYHVIGMISVHPGRVGRNIHGVEVLGSLDDLPQVMQRLSDRGRRPQRLVLASDQVEGARVRALLDAADSLGLTLARLPRLTEFKNLDERIEIRPIAVEDLLGRPQAVLDRAGIMALIRGRRILVTGAGGSIGSELVRQIADIGPSHLSLVEASEFNLYSIDMEMHEKHPHLSRRAILADVRDRSRINEVFAQERPDLVFHAAALKHVPMVEANPVEGVLTNAVGSRNVADAALGHGVIAMVLISTDKAVNPTNVMGATKRIAERYCQSLDLADTSTRFITVRFGNVLGSTGSVVPLFQRQLAAGGPITVTHPDVIRYFMTIREAVELVLQASALGSNGRDQGKIYVLDMGEPVRIIDLARQMIRLAGLRPDHDIKIEVTGLRPGEKLFEEIFHGAEPPIPTERQGILLASPRAVDHAEISAAIAEIEAAARTCREDRVLDGVHHLVPEYRPAVHAAQ